MNGAGIVLHTFEAKHHLQGNVSIFRNVIVGSSGDDKGCAGFFAVYCGQLNTASEAIFPILKVKDAITGPEKVSFQMVDTTHQQLQIRRGGLEARILSIGIVLISKKNNNQ
jgi:hypothetical protein